MHLYFIYTMFSKYTNWLLVTFCVLWWCLPEFFTIWDEIWYIDKFYVYKFNQMHKLTFGDLWWPLVINWSIEMKFVMHIFFMYKMLTKYTNWPLVTFSDLWWFLPEFFTIWDEIWYIGKFCVYKFNQMHKLTFRYVWWPLDVFTLFFDQLR